MQEEVFSYYGQMTPINPDRSNTQGIHQFMLEELVVNTLNRLEERLRADIKNELTSLKKELGNEIKKQNEIIKNLIKFKEKIESEEKPKEEKELIICDGMVEIKPELKEENKKLKKK